MMTAPAPLTRWTFAGLAIAFLGLPGIALIHRSLMGDATAAWPPLLLREGAIFGLLGALLFIVRRKERLPWASIGLKREGFGRTALWALAAFALLAAGTALALGLLHILGLRYGSGHAAAPPLAITALVVLRAGIVEEVFYRGYAIERLRRLTGSGGFAGMISLVAFALSHYHQGLAGMLVAAILGAILTALYLWRRNLAANMTGHFLIDFIPNVLLPALGA